MEIYLVGGAVRDILMGIKPTDRDYVVVNSSRDEMLALGFKEVGKGFPVFLNPINSCEYALARKERKVYDKDVNEHQAFEFETDSVTLKDDLLRRDLTINSIAMDEKTGEFIDPFDGIRDIKEKRLIHTSAAFIEDPLRVLRVARFNAKFSDFSIDKGTLALMGAVANTDGFKNLPKERVFMELEKALEYKDSYVFFDVLHNSGSSWHFRKMYDGVIRKHLEKDQNILFRLAQDMLKRIKTSDKMLKYVAFASSLENPEKFGESIGAPSDWIKTSCKIKKAFEELESSDCEKGDLKGCAESDYEAIAILDAFRNPKMFDVFVVIADTKRYYNVDFFKEIYTDMMSVTIKDVDQSLKGAEIGEKIRELRIKKIMECIRNF